MAQRNDIRLWSAAVAAAIALAGCGGDRAGGSGDAARTGDSVAAADSVPAVPAETTAALPAPAESTPSATGPGISADTSAAKPPAPPRTDSAAAPAAAGAVADESAQARAARQGQPSPQPTSPSPPAEAPLRDEYHRAPRDTVDQVTYEGWKQYNLNCARCHGEDVLGTTIAPHLIMSLKPDGPINTQQAFMQVVCAGRKERGMPAWCELGLGMDKIQAIYSYVKARSEGKIGPGRPAVRPSS